MKCRLTFLGLAAICLSYVFGGAGCGGGSSGPAAPFSASDIVGRWAFDRGVSMSVLRVTEIDLMRGDAMYTMHGSFSGSVFHGNFTTWVGGAPVTGNVSINFAVAGGLLDAAITAGAPLNALALENGIRAGEVLLDNGNLEEVDGSDTTSPSTPTTFSITQASRILFVSDYHYYNHGTAPGTISLLHADGTVYGPWQTTGRVGQGDVANAYWECLPDTVVKAGTYTVVDSEPTTWSFNARSGGQGMSLVRGIAAP